MCGGRSAQVGGGTGVYSNSVQSDLLLHCSLPVILYLGDIHLIVGRS